MRGRLQLSISVLTYSLRAPLFALALVLTIVAMQAVHAQTFTVIHTLAGVDGSVPYAGLTQDRAGDSGSPSVALTPDLNAELTQLFNSKDHPLPIIPVVVGQVNTRAQVAALIAPGQRPTHLPDLARRTALTPAWRKFGCSRKSPWNIRA